MKILFFFFFFLGGGGGIAKLDHVWLISMYVGSFLKIKVQTEKFCGGY